jgi:HEAT repeat protein
MYAAQTQSWKEKLGLAIDGVEDSNDPKSVSRSAQLIESFIKQFRTHPDIVESLLGPHRLGLIATLLNTAKTHNPYVLSASIGLLAELDSSEGYEIAADAINSSNPYVREAGIRLFGITAPEGALENLIPLLDDAHGPAGVAAVRAITNRIFKPALPRLLEIFGERRLEARNQFAKRPPIRSEFEPLLKAIAALQGKQAVPLLVDIATHDVSLRSYAVRRLVELNAPEAAPQIAHLLTDPSRTLQEEMLRLVHRVGYKPALPFIRPILVSPESILRKKALQIVCDWQDAESCDTLDYIAQHDVNPILRVQALLGLAAMKKQGIEPLLIHLSGDTNSKVRGTVAMMLSGSSELSYEGHQVLRQLALDPDEHVKELALRGPREILLASDLTKMSPPSVPLLIPADLESEVTTLLYQLNAWRGFLPSIAGLRSVEEISEVDQALATLLQALREAEC